MALIEGDILVGKLYGLCDENEVLHINIGTLQGIVDRMPIEQDRPHGEWIYHKEWELDGECAFECSNCNMGVDLDFNFCPNCGAKMRKEGDEK